MEESLDAAISNPETFDLPAFRRIASSAYGGAGNQGQINSYLSAGSETIPPLARTIKHLLYGAGDEVDRLDDVLDNAEWKVKRIRRGARDEGLAIVYPERWLPLFIYRGESGKRAVMRLPELPVEPLDERGKSRAQLAKESNDALRDLLRPYYGDDQLGGDGLPLVALETAGGRGGTAGDPRQIRGARGRTPPASGMGAARPRNSWRTRSR